MKKIKGQYAGFRRISLEGLDEKQKSHLRTVMDRIPEGLYLELGELKTRPNGTPQRSEDSVIFRMKDMMFSKRKVFVSLYPHGPYEEKGNALLECDEMKFKVHLVGAGRDKTHIRGYITLI